MTRERDTDDERLLSVFLIEHSKALRKQAELIRGAVLQRLGMSVTELEPLHATLTASRRAAKPANGSFQ